MKNDEIMITVRFESSIEDTLHERDMTFLVIKDITLRDFIEGLYYGLKKIRVNDSPDIEKGVISDSKCFEILDEYLKNHSEIAVNYIFKDSVMCTGGSMGIIDFNKKIDGKPVYDFSLSSLGIVTSSCIMITDRENITLESLFDSKNSVSYIINSDAPEYNISTRDITSVEDSVIDINPAGDRPQPDLSGMFDSLIGTFVSVGLGVVVRYIVKNPFGSSMAIMTLAMGAVSCISMIVNMYIQYRKNIKSAKEWQKNYENYIKELIRRIVKFQKQDILYLNTLYPSIDKIFHKVETLNGSIFERSQNDSDFMTVSLGGSDQIEPLFKINAEKKEKIEEDNIRYMLTPRNNYMPFDFEIIVPDDKRKKDIRGWILDIKGLFNKSKAPRKVSSGMPYLSELAYNFANHTAGGEGGITGFKYLKDYSDSENKPPLLLELKNCGALGVISEQYEKMNDFVRYIVFELSFYHSPENIQFVFFFRKEENIREQNRIISNYRYLPHANELFENRSQFIFDKKSAGEVFSQLFSIVNQRKGDHESDSESQSSAEKANPKYTQIICVVFDDYDIKETAFSRFLPEAPEQNTEFQNTLGLSFVFLQDNRDKLPRYCGNIIELRQDSGTLRKRCNIIGREMLPESFSGSSREYGDSRKTFTNDYIFSSGSDDKYKKAYRQLSSVYYKRIVENGKVPAKVSLFEVWGIKKEDITDCVKESNVRRQIKQYWESSDITAGLSVPVGMNERGVTFLDMHQKGDGPHGLVAGTTGSGKSETLLTYVIGCCMKYKPEDLNFMLIDMKGGGFSDRLGRLPHLVGSVTNTTGEKEGISSEYMLKRFLYTLNAEIVRREICLKDLNTDNIDDYIEARKKVIEYRRRITEAEDEEARNKILEEINETYGDKNKDNFCKACNPSETKDDPEPLAHLLLIVDEFTELKRFSSDSNGIDFIKDITTIARVGRTLGFHIILVSQNIEGAITDDIRVNSKARICLRVATKGASKDMIGTADAASPHMPYNGRAYILVGERYEYFQSAYTGDNRNISLKAPVNVTLVSETGNYNTDFYHSKNDNERLNNKKEKADKDDNQLNYIINAINSIMKEYGGKDGEYKKPRKLFPDPLPADEKSVMDKTKWEGMPDEKHNM